MSLNIFCYVGLKSRSRGQNLEFLHCFSCPLCIAFISQLILMKLGTSIHQHKTMCHEPILLCRSKAKVTRSNLRIFALYFMSPPNLLLLQMDLKKVGTLDGSICQYDLIDIFTLNFVQPVLYWCIYHYSYRFETCYKCISVSDYFWWIIFL